MTYEAFWQPLTIIYDAGEAKAVARLVAEVRCGLSLADLMAGKEMTGVEGIHQRLLSGEPVQYVLGQAEFYGRQFSVGPGVLIPRPETEELCRWIIAGTKDKRNDGTWQILDIGTGSGCIACTLAAELPEAQVEAWDISDEALHIARSNAERLGVHVNFKKQDIINYPLELARFHRSTFGRLLPEGDKKAKRLKELSIVNYQLIISNPPYICPNEAGDMKPWVLNHEPECALFVPGDDPLLFYRHICNYAKTSLREGGQLYFEANPHYIKELEELLHCSGFNSIRTKDDQFGKTRFISACK